MDCRAPYVCLRVSECVLAAGWLIVWSYTSQAEKRVSQKQEVLQKLTSSLHVHTPNDGVL